MGVEKTDDQQPKGIKSGGELVADRTEPNEWETLVPIKVGDHTVALLFHTGFLSAEPSGRVIANRGEPKEWEQFRITRHADGRSSLFAISTGRYLSAQSGGGEIIANSDISDREKVGDWEKFTPVVIEGNLCMKAFSGHYLSAQK